MTFTLEQISKYLESQDSCRDILHNLSEENILKANAVQEEPVTTITEQEYQEQRTHCMDRNLNWR